MVAAALIALPPGTARADRTYIGPASGPNAVWHLTSNWAGGVLPGTSDTAFLTSSDNTSRTVTLDVDALIAHLRVDNNGSGSNTFSQPGFNFYAYQEDIGYQGIAAGYGKGLYIQGGGANTAPDYLSLGSAAGAYGQYTLNAGTVQAATNTGAQGEFIGGTGIGLFTNVAGTNIVGSPDSGSAGRLYLGFVSGAVGTYNLTGPLARTTVNGSAYIGGNVAGPGGAGYLNVSAGTMAVTGTLKIWPTSNSGVTLSGGTLSVTSLDTSTFPARLNWTAGSLSINSPLAVFDTAPLGNFTLKAGQSLTVASETLGGQGNGKFGQVSQQGGTQTINGSLTVGTTGASLGLYQLLAGSLNVRSSVYIGTGDADGTFNQGAGTFAVSGDFNLGTQYGNATYTMDDSGPGSLLTVAGSLRLTSDTDNVSFAIHSGAVVVAGDIRFTSLMSGSNQLILTGGSLTAGNLRDLSGTGGPFNPPQFLWAAGALTITGPEGLSIGPGNLLSSASIVPAQSLTVDTTLSITSTGALTLAGGNVTVGALDLNSTPNHLTWTSGNLRINGPAGLTLSAISPAGLSLTVPQGQRLTVDASLTVAAGATLSFSGALIPFGSLSTGDLALAGGTVNTDILANYFPISGFGTVFAPSGVINLNVITQAGGNLNFSTTGGLINRGTLYLSAGYQLQSPGSIYNDGDGVIVGPGTVAAPFANSGTILVRAGAFRTAGPFFNDGVIELADPAANFGFSAILVTNRATLEGHGKVSAALANAAVIEATGGTLTLSGPLTNSASGTLRAAAGTKILIQGPANFPTNAGLISLVGGTFDTGSQPLTNAGQITGFGTLSTGGLTNNAFITLTGGPTTINGPVTNAPGGVLRIQLNPATFTGPLLNNGALSITATTFTPPGTLSGYGSTIVSPGATLTASAITQSTLTVQGLAGAPGRVNIPSRQLGATTPLTGRAVPPSVSSIATLSLAADATGYLATLDLADNDLILTSTPLASATAAIAAWYHAGARDGRGLSASVAGSSSGPDALATLGAISNANGAGASLFATFDGLAVAATDVLVKYTYLGDTNLDGTVDAADLASLLTGLHGALHGWANGDANYDGQVTAADLSLLLASLAHQAGSFGDPGAIAGAVPEPAALLPAPAALAIIRRRRPR